MYDVYRMYNALMFSSMMLGYRGSNLVMRWHPRTIEFPDEYTRPPLADTDVNGLV